MIKIKLGCNFDPALRDIISELNNQYPDAVIDELYGSDRNHAYLTARPAYRLPDISMRTLEEYVSGCIAIGVDFNYTMNSLYIGSKRELAKRERSIRDLTRDLESMGVRTITVSNPIVAQIVRSQSSSIGLEVSTIAGIQHATQIKAWHDSFGITKCCVALSKNRSFGFLRTAASFCNENNIRLCLLANEFCSTGGGLHGTYSTDCIYRNSCFLCHSHNITKQDDLSLQGYPMARCVKSRDSKAIWLKCMFIRPEDLSQYKNIGVDQFKVTGRTGNTSYLRFIANSYMSRKLDGNLLSLWKPIETINAKTCELTFKHPVFIQNSKLHGFLNYWLNHSHECSEEICGDTCRYCDEFSKRI